MPSIGSEQCNLPSLAQSIGRYEVRRSEAFKRIRNRKRSIKEAFGRGRTRQGYTAGHSGGKLLSPARRRDVANVVQHTHEVSERRAYTVVN
jgi:hypothetical protein